MNALGVGWEVIVQHLFVSRRVFTTETVRFLTPVPVKEDGEGTTALYLYVLKTVTTVVSSCRMWLKFEFKNCFFSS